MIYSSTSCLKNPKNVIRVLNEYQNAGINNVELGSVHEYFEIEKLKDFDLNFIIHNYFPPPKIPFIFNLASTNKSIRKSSIKLALTAIDLCYKIESPLYTFHAGFRVDPSELGKALERDKIVNKNTAFRHFINSVNIIISYAKERGITIGVESNVIPEYNLVNGKNELALLVEYPDIELFYQSISKKDLGILLDLGHIAVSSHWLNFDKDKFVQLCSDKVCGIHISNNNGLKDQHKSLTKDCWAISKIKKFKNLPIILETMNLEINELKTNIDLVKSSLS